MQTCISRKYRRPSPSATSPVKAPLNPWILTLCKYHPFPKPGWNIHPPRLASASVFIPQSINYCSALEVLEGGSLATRAGQMQQRIEAIGSTDGGILLDDQILPTNGLHGASRQRLGRVDYISAAGAGGRHPTVPHSRRKHKSWPQQRWRWRWRWSGNHRFRRGVWWGAGTWTRSISRETR